MKVHVVCMIVACTVMVDGQTGSSPTRTVPSGRRTGPELAWLSQPIDPQTLSAIPIAGNRCPCQPSPTA